MSWPTLPNISIQSLDTNAGHIASCFVLLGIGAAFYHFSIPKSEDLIVFALGVMARSMNSPSK